VFLLVYGWTLNQMATLAKAEKMRYNLHANSHGGYGEEVITAGCGPVIEGSIPSSHPIKTPSNPEGVLIKKPIYLQRTLSIPS
jgi:hypothetical protein